MKEQIINFEHYDLHIIPNNNFKNFSMNVCFMNDVDVSNYLTRTLLFDIFSESTKNYPSYYLFKTALDNLYGASISSYMERRGSTGIGQISIDFIDPKYIKEPDYLEQIIKLFFTVIFEPNIDNNVFNEALIKKQKNQYINIYNCLRETPARYASYRAGYAFDSNSLSTQLLTGTKEQIDAVTNEKLIDAYHDMLLNDKVDIYLCGNVTDEMIELVKKYATFKNKKNYQPKLFITNKTRENIQEVNEKENILQSHLFYFFNLVELNEYDRDYTINILDEMLGGNGMGTILSDIIREKNNLCYTTFSSYRKHDGLLIFYTGIDAKNKEKTKDLINDILINLKTYLTEEKLYNAKMHIVSDLKSYNDNLESIVCEKIYENIGMLEPLEVRIEKYQSISLENIYNIIDKVKLNTIYCLEGVDNGNN